MSAFHGVDDDDEQVVYTEHELHDVTSGELEPRLGSQGQKDTDVEYDRGTYEEGDLDQCFPRLDDVCFSVEYPQIQYQERDYADNEDYPRGCSYFGQLFRPSKMNTL